MAAQAAAAAVELHAVAQRWADATDAERRPLKALVERIVGYPCKIACQVNHESVDIFVQSNRTGEIEDFLELQPTGAIGVIYDQYENPDASAVVAVDNRCEDYNSGLGVEFADESDSEDEGDEDEGDSDEDAGAETTASKEKKD